MPTTIICWNPCECDHEKQEHDTEVEYGDGVVYECCLCDCGAYREIKEQPEL
jgi:hypothetical protein